MRTRPKDTHVAREHMGRSSPRLLPQPRVSDVSPPMPPAGLARGQLADRR